MPQFTNENPIHIIARSNNKDWFQAPLEDCWEVFKETLDNAQQKYGFKTHAFVLMSNHYHWLMSLKEENLGSGMCYFQTTTSRKIGRLSNRINRIYGARYKPTEILEPIHYANTYRYIYQNPVRAGICNQVEDYPWSTIHQVQKAREICGPFGAEIPWLDLLSWLNTPLTDTNCERVRLALRRKTFSYPRDQFKLRPEIQL
jgi:putative transposase